MEPRNRFQGMNSARLCSLAGRYDNPIPTLCLAPIDFLKIPAQWLLCCSCKWANRLEFTSSMIDMTIICPPGCSDPSTSLRFLLGRPNPLAYHNFPSGCTDPSTSYVSFLDVLAHVLAINFPPGCTDPFTSIRFLLGRPKPLACHNFPP